MTPPVRFVRAVARAFNVAKGRDMLPWAVIALYLIVSLVTFDQIEEDAFIYLRVAANIADGFGYVYNRGGEHIEVGSSISWQYLLALVHWVGLDMVVFSKLLGVACGAATLHFLWRISRIAIVDRRLHVLPSLLLAVSYPFYNGSRGLETLAFALSVVALAYAVTEPRLRMHWHWFAIATLLTRSEGFICLPGLIGFFYFERLEWRRHAMRLGACVAAILAVGVWRYSYFNDLVPHAYYMKIQENGTVALRTAVAFLRITWLWVPLGIGAFGLLDRRVWDRALVTLAILVAPYAWWGITSQGMAQYNRHLVVPLSLLLVIACRGFERLIARWPVLTHTVIWGAEAFSAWLLLGSPNMRGGFTLVPSTFASDAKELWSTPRRVAWNFWAFATNRPRGGLTNEDLSTQKITSTSVYVLGDFIRRSYPRGITVVYDQAGQTPWYAGLDKTFIDPYGLTDRVAGFATFNYLLDRNPSRGFAIYRDVSLKLLKREPARTWDFRRAADHVFAMRPHVIILGIFSVPTPDKDGRVIIDQSNLSGVIGGDPRLDADYVLHTWRFNRIYERRDIVKPGRWTKGAVGPS
jgi:hypothetical protein